MRIKRSCRAFWLAVTVLTCMAPVRISGAGASYRNPVIAGDLADPAVILHEGVYYLYATGDVAGDNGYRVYTSTNLVDWERGDIVFRPGRPHVWAPDIWRDPVSGRFFLYYTVSQTVGVAEGAGPLGPFTIRRKLFDRAIDAHLFRDDDYHQKRTDGIEWGRFICIDPLWFDSDGNLTSRATRGTPHPAPTPLAKKSKSSSADK